ncbi:interleukin-15 isoform X1 [Falco biarmicus]|uniref:interleukin-15 isoform X1 n=2 Tax=Falco cherrug TaxID=345164 RepID=UPI00247AEACE|nr:interleukin-15 isoform X1 [Falco cherrug]XP_056219011.1 interleukin-15 isoform X1 [Falco biarmicus]
MTWEPVAVASPLRTPTAQVPRCNFLIQFYAPVLSNGPAGRMLGTAQPTRNSAGTLSRLESQSCRLSGCKLQIKIFIYLNMSCSLVQCSSFHKTRKTHLKSVCLQYQLCLLLNCHFFGLLKNEMGLIIFFLCASVPKTAAGQCKWAEVLKDLEQIKTSKDIDVSLYTANTDEDKECQEPVMRCFFLETNVILQECLIKNCSKTQDVLNIWKNGNISFEKNKLNSTTSAKCKECEEYEEKNFTEFIQSFVKVIQKECKH